MCRNRRPDSAACAKCCFAAACAGFDARTCSPRVRRAGAMPTVHGGDCIGFASALADRFWPVRTRKCAGGAHAFRCPLDEPGSDEFRMFYVRDNPVCRFLRNAFALEPIPFLDPEGRQSTMSSVQPGISFFDRPDQQSLFKIHLPYLLRTPRAVDSLFTAANNRDISLTVLAGLVETDWYAHPVNLVIRKPKLGVLDIAAGDIVAQVVFIPRNGRHANVRVVQPDSSDMQMCCSPGRFGGYLKMLRGDLLMWYVSHTQDRSAYKRLARSYHGRIKNQQ